MADTVTRKPSTPWPAWLMRHGGWLLLGLTLLLVLCVRVRLRNMPLERDEGEYAYAGQLILQGVPPYKEAYNMKLPGTYAGYAVIMAILGQTPSGIHLGLMLVNLATIVLVFLLGRELLDDTTGAVAALAYALMSLSPSVLGLAGHATHFVVLPALAGLLVLLRTVQRNPLLPGPQDNKTTDHRPLDHKLLTSNSHLLAASSHLLTPGFHLLAAGILLGLAFLAKQHGVFFGVFGILFLLWSRFYEILTARADAQRPYSARRHPNHRTAQDRTAANEVSEVGTPVRQTIIARGNQWKPATNGPSAAASAVQTPPGTAAPPVNMPALPLGATLPERTMHARASAPTPRPVVPDIPWGRIEREFVALAVGFAIPYLITCVVLGCAGVFGKFIFWTVKYASQYASAVSFTEGERMLRLMAGVVIGPSLPFWLLAAAGAMLLWGDPRLEPTRRFFLAALLVCSAASASLGFYFREHYFILVLPALALLGGVAVSRSIRLVRHDRSIELFLALPVLLLLLIATGSALIGNGTLWFTTAPDKVVRDTYGTSLFADSATAAEFVKTNTPPNSRIAVIGSEPEIYFLSHRRSATGYIYTYPLVENHRYALKMQQEMIAEIEKSRPDYLVYVGDVLSWMPKPNCNRTIYDWFNAYWTTNMDLVTTLKVEGQKEKEADAESATQSSLLILRRKR